MKVIYAQRIWLLRRQHHDAFGRMMRTMRTRRVLDIC